MRKFTARQQIRIFVLDDSPIVCQGLSQVASLERGVEICGQSAEGEKALQSIAHLKPDMVVLDIAMQGINGLEFIRQIKTIHPETRVLILSMLEEALYAERALRAGAS